jgi:DNA polymerase-4
VDCDAFFVQVARLEDPLGAGRTPLLIVGGSPGGRGVVTSASYEARAFGVRSAMPTAQALRLCPEATVVGVPRAAISRRSRAVRQALEDLAPIVEAASVDEFYLDLTGTERLFRGEALEATAERIRRTVLEHTEISTSVGGGTNRLVAKLATSRAKPAGVHVVPPGAEATFVRQLRLADIPGVGPALLGALGSRGIQTVEQALAVEPEWLERWVGLHRASWLRERLHGRGPEEVDPDRDRKSISSERTFHADIASDAALDVWLLSLVESVGSTLRGQGLRCRTVSVKLRDQDFLTRQRVSTLDEPVESDRALLAATRPLLRDLRAARPVPTRLLGVGLGGLEPARAPRQLVLFSDPSTSVETERERKLARAIDGLRARFGRGAVSPARLAESEPDGPSGSRGSPVDG